MQELHQTESGPRDAWMVSTPGGKPDARRRRTESHRADPCSARGGALGCPGPRGSGQLSCSCRTSTREMQSETQSEIPRPLSRSLTDVWGECPWGQLFRACSCGGGAAQDSETHCVSLCPRDHARPGASHAPQCGLPDGSHYRQD